MATIDIVMSVVWRSVRLKDNIYINAEECEIYGTVSKVNNIT